MATEAQTHREVLVKHGLSESVLEQFVQMLASSMTRCAGITGDPYHIGALGELRRVPAAILRAVRVMDGRTRQRYQNDGRLPVDAWPTCRVGC